MEVNQHFPSQTSVFFPFSIGWVGVLVTEIRTVVSRSFGGPDLYLIIDPNTPRTSPQTVLESWFRLIEAAVVDLGKMDPCIESLSDRVSQAQAVCVVVW